MNYYKQLVKIPLWELLRTKEGATLKIEKRGKEKSKMKNEKRISRTKELLMYTRFKLGNSGMTVFNLTLVPQGLHIYQVFSITTDSFDKQFLISDDSCLRYEAWPMLWAWKGWNRVKTPQVLTQACTIDTLSSGICLDHSVW